MFPGFREPHPEESSPSYIGGDRTGNVPVLHRKTVFQGDVMISWAISLGLFPSFPCTPIIFHPLTCNAHSSYIMPLSPVPDGIIRSAAAVFSPRHPFGKHADEAFSHSVQRTAAQSCGTAAASYNYVEQSRGALGLHASTGGPELFATISGGGGSPFLLPDDPGDGGSGPTGASR